MVEQVVFEDFIQHKKKVASPKQVAEISATATEMQRSLGYQPDLKYPIDALTDNYDLVFFKIHQKTNTIYHVKHRVDRRS